MFEASNVKASLHNIKTLLYEKLALDILTFAGKDYLVIEDYYSKWIDMVELIYKIATEIISKTKTIFSSNDIPKSFIADNMPMDSRKKQFKLVRNS